MKYVQHKDVFHLYPHQFIFNLRCDDLSLNIPIMNKINELLSKKEFGKKDNNYVTFYRKEKELLTMIVAFKDINNSLLFKLSF